MSSSNINYRNENTKPSGPSRPLAWSKFCCPSGCPSTVGCSEWPDYFGLVLFFFVYTHSLPFFLSLPTMAATNDKLDDAIFGLSHNVATLTSLNLSSNQLGDEGAGRLAEALAFNSTLTNLNLKSNNVGDKGASRLAEALATNSSLTSLNLMNNWVGDEGAGRLAEALAINSALTTLNLSI